MTHHRLAATGLTLLVCLLEISTPPVAGAAPVLVRDTPYIQNVKTTSAVVAWFTNAEGTAGVVQYGTTTAYGSSVNSTSRNWPLLLTDPSGSTR